MKKNYFLQDELDINKQLTIIWKSRIFILSISIISALIIYLFNLIENKKFKIILSPNISIKDEKVLQAFRFSDTYITTTLLDKNSPISIDKIESNFDYNFLSRENLYKFIFQENNSNNLKDFFKKNKISVDEYFNSNNFGKQDTKVNKYSYFLIYSKEIEGSTFVNEYILFINNKMSKELNIQIISFIEKEIFITERALKIAKEISQEMPNLIDTSKDRSMYNKGSLVLNFELQEYKNMLKFFKNDTVPNYFTIELSTITTKLDGHTIKPIEGFFLGFFISLLIVIVRRVIIR
jgi:hypothetical protein